MSQQKAICALQSNNAKLINKKGKIEKRDNLEFYIYCVSVCVLYIESHDWHAIPLRLL